MDCPVCKTERLVMSERQGIEIDSCPRCRGVWLDRGELDKIIERASDLQPTAQAGPAPVHQQQPMQPHASMHDSDFGKYMHKRTRGPGYWLKEIFDL